MDVTKSERFEQLDRLLTEHDGIRWVGLMNTLKAQVEEMICQEFIYI